jgi:hypothetical protein
MTRPGATCAACGLRRPQDARGDQCDGCGNLLNPTELINPRCKITGTKPVLRSTKHIFLDLPKLSPQLQVRRAGRQGAADARVLVANCMCAGAADCIRLATARMLPLSVPKCPARRGMALEALADTWCMHMVHGCIPGPRSTSPPPASRAAGRATACS